jgi:hypothetical protein
MALRVNRFYGNVSDEPRSELVMDEDGGPARTNSDAAAPGGRCAPRTVRGGRSTVNRSDSLFSARTWTRHPFAQPSAHLPTMPSRSRSHAAANSARPRSRRSSTAADAFRGAGGAAPDARSRLRTRIFVAAGDVRCRRESRMDGLAACGERHRFTVRRLPGRARTSCRRSTSMSVGRLRPS